MDLRNVFKGLEEKASSVIKAEEGDYEKDGLLYCGKCNTPKQCEIELWGEKRKPMCLCECMIAKKEAEEAKRKHYEFVERCIELRRKGFPEEKMLEWNFEHDDMANEHLSKVMHKYVDNFDEMLEHGKGLLLYGTVGTGKTFAAACVANALIDKGIPCLVTNFSRLINTIHGMYAGKQEYIDSLNSFKLLVIDDLATEANTEYRNEIVTAIINSRYNAGLPTIITTNLTPTELKNAEDISKQRVYSRLFDMCIPIEVKGKDRRRERLKDDYRHYSDLLGL